MAKPGVERPAECVETTAKTTLGRITRLGTGRSDGKTAKQRDPSFECEGGGSQSLHMVPQSVLTARGAGSKTASMGREAGSGMGNGRRDGKRMQTLGVPCSYTRVRGPSRFGTRRKPLNVPCTWCRRRATASKQAGPSGHVQLRKSGSVTNLTNPDKRDTPDVEIRDWRAVCGKTARTVRREGRPKAFPTPINLLELAR
jgi:hypothetical protein